MHPLEIAAFSRRTVLTLRDQEKPTLLADGGVENVNGAVDELVASGLLRRLLAMTEIAFSNSLTEAWWRTLKHQWLGGLLRYYHCSAA